MIGRRAATAAIVLGLVVLVAGCFGGDDEPHVVLYVSADEYVAREVVRAFEAETGLRVRMVGDTEAKKTTGLVERLRAERDRPQADVFWNSEQTMSIALADEGVLVPYTSPATEDWPERHRDAQRRWYGFAARARVIVYAPSRVAPDEIPQAWTDLTRDYFDERVAMADPRFGTTGGHLGAMKAWWDRSIMPGYYEAFLEGLRDNHVRLLPGGNAGVVRAVAEGDVDVGMTDTDDVYAAQRNGYDVAMVLAPHTREAEPGNGTMLIPNTVGLVAGSTNSEAAGRLIDFLLSETTERLLAESDSRNTPLRPGLAEAYPDLAIDDPLAVDPRRAAAQREIAVAMAMKVLGRSGRADPDASEDEGEDPGADADEEPDAESDAG